MDHVNDIHICLNDAYACRKVSDRVSKHARRIYATLDTAQYSSIPDIEARILEVLKALLICKEAECLSLPLLAPAHTATLAIYSHLTVLRVDKIPLVVAVHTLTMCTTIQDVEFSMLLFSAKDSIPPHLDGCRQLTAMRRIKIHSNQCHFMDLLCFFSCPSLEILDVANQRGHASVGERLEWFLSCEASFTDFMIESASNMKKLTVYDNTERDPLDVGIAQTLNYVFNTILHCTSVLKKVCLPRLTDMPFKCANHTFIRDLLDAFELLSQKLPVDRLGDFPPPKPGKLQVYIQGDDRAGACPRPREQHVPLARDHSTNIIPHGYIFTCNLCPEKKANERSLMAIRTFAQSAKFHYDIRIGDKIVMLHC